MLRHQIKPFDFISSAEALVNEKKRLYHITSLGPGPPEAAAGPIGEECRGFEGYKSILEDVKPIFETYLKLKM